MAATHLQVQEDASIINRPTVLWPSSKQEQKGVIKRLFENNNWTVSSIENQSGSFWKVICNCLNQELKINLYISSIRDEARADDEFKMQLGSTYPERDEIGWITLVLGIYTIPKNDGSFEYILSGYDIQRYDFSTNPSIRGTRTSGLQNAKIFGFYKTDKSFLFRPDFLYYYISNIEDLREKKSQGFVNEPISGDIPKLNTFLAAIRTKPFLLLAGISGTGKSQIVKEMAFSSCPDVDDLQENKVSPGNYCLIEVKPNWHDSSELLGYDSAIKKHYVVTKFVKFVVKAMRYPEVPFFVCLDEMNLAPVEQYFAEFLSVLESRKLVDGKIISEPLIDREFFMNNLVALDLFDLPASQFKSLPVTNVELTDEALGENAEIWHRLQEEGLCIPQNLIVIGTVNMDETTHQFSRKVIDRAMTFEMNEADFDSYFEDKVTLDYVDEPLDAALFLARNVSGNRAIEEINNLIEDFKPSVAAMLNALNVALEDTPFKIAYRVQNELILYYAELLRENTDADQEQLLATALDDIMMMKVLPRIEGDDELLGNRSEGALARLMKFASDNNLEHSIDKIDEMLKRLERSHFTSFWP